MSEPSLFAVSLDVIGIDIWAEECKWTFDGKEYLVLLDRHRASRELEVVSRGNS